MNPLFLFGRRMSPVRKLLMLKMLTGVVAGGNLLDVDRTEGTPDPTTTSNATSPRVMDTTHYFVGIRSDNYYVKSYATASVSDGTVTVASTTNNMYGVGFPVAVESGSNYTLSADAEHALVGIGFYDSEWHYVSNSETSSSVLPRTFTIPTGVSYAVIIFRSSVGATYTYTNIQLVKNKEGG